MIKKMAFLACISSLLALSAESNAVQEDAFSQKTVYTITNNTQFAMDIAWQSGGGFADVLTGLKGNLYLTANTAPYNSGKIVTNGTDCLDYLDVKSQSLPDTVKVKGEGICKRSVSIEFDGEDVKTQKLVLKTK